jgi:hypothetical protein
VGGAGGGGGGGGYIILVGTSAGQLGSRFSPPVQLIAPQ